MIKQKSNTVYILNFFLAVYFSELVFPRINPLFHVTIVSLVALSAWLFIGLTSHRHIHIGPKTKYHGIFIFTYLLLIVYAYFFGYAVIAHRYMSLALIYFGSYIFDFYSEHFGFRQLKTPLKIVFLLSLITTITTLIALLIDPYIARSIKSSGEYSANLASQGIGGYSFIYFTSLCTVLILFLFIKCRIKYKKVLWFAAYLFLAFFIIKSNYLMAFIVVLSGTALLIIQTALSNSKLRFSTFLFVITLLVVVLGSKDTIINILPQRISKVLIINNSFAGLPAIYKEFAGDRWPLMLRSIASFFQHPLLGLVGSEELGYSGGYLTGISHHSFILDTFALFGFIGGALTLYTVVSPFSSKYYNGVDASLRITMLICTLLVLVFNNATDSIALASFVIYPFIQFYTKGHQDYGY